VLPCPSSGQQNETLDNRTAWDSVSAVRKKWAVLGPCLLLGCSGPRAAAQPPPPSVPPPPAVTLATVPSGAAAAAEPSSGAPDPSALLEPIDPAPATPPLAHVEILFPIPEKPIAVDKAAKYRVRVLVEDFALGSTGNAVLVSLDDGEPHRVTTLEEPIELGQLVPAGTEVREGPHRLFVVATLATGEMVKPAASGSRAPFATVHFFVGARGAPASDTPRLVYGQPRGAFAPGPIPLDFYVVGARLGADGFRVAVTVTGPEGSRSQELRRWQAMRIVGLGAGSHRVVLELLGPDGSPTGVPGARVEQSFTVASP
jgi:hypothetical protein